MTEEEAPAARKVRPWCGPRRPEGWVAAAWCDATRKFRWVILVACLGVCGLAPVAAQLIGRTSNPIQLPKGAPAATAADHLGAYFPAKVHMGSTVALLEVRDGTLADVRARWCAYEEALAAAIEAEHPCESPEAMTRNACFLRAPPTSWCLLAAKNATFLAGTAVDAPTADGDPGASTAATFVVVYDQRAGPHKLMQFVNFFDGKTAELLKHHGLDHVARVGITGWDVFAVAAVEGANADLEAVDTRSLPAALVVMAATLGSLPLLVIPMLNMLLTTLLGFAIMAQVALKLQVASFAPSVMMSLTLALGFDYSLFICSRYLEARRDGAADEATRVRAVLRGAGHTILVSGSTLIVCFLGLLAFPSAMLRGIGVSVSVGIAAAMLVNLTVAPALLHACGESLVASQERCWRALTRRRGAATPSRELAAARLDASQERCWPRRRGGAEASSLDAPLLLETDDDAPRKPSRSPWRRASRFIWDDRRAAVVVVLAIVAASAPACRYAPRLKAGADPVMTTPSPSAPELTLRRLGRAFGAGAVAPMTVLFDTGITGGLFTDASLDAMDDVLYGDLATASQTLTVIGLTRVGGKRVKVADYVACLQAVQPTPWCVSLAGLYESLVSSDGAAATATVLLSSSPYDEAGFEWIKKARKRLAEPRPPFTQTDVYGNPCVLKDMIDTLYRQFPVVVAVTLCVVFCLLAAAFKSVAVAVRSVCGMCLTLSFSFGCCVLCYQEIDASPVAFLTTKTSDPGISWIGPLIVFTVVVGLALDYDVFLLARVHEYRFHLQMCDRDATLEAVHKTGVLITSAGLIMAIAFGGLFMSQSTILNQTAFVLFVAVLYDTFVIRTLLMPALLSLSRDKAWWPTTPPPGVDRDDALRLHDHPDAASETSEARSEII